MPSRTDDGRYIVPTKWERPIDIALVVAYVVAVWWMFFG